MYSKSTCRDLSPLLVKLDLAGEELERVTEHLAGCAGCRDAIGLLAPLEPTGIEPGALIENYRVERELGRGGTSVVVLAQHVSLPRHVAIKIMHRELAASPEAAARFSRDAASIAQLRGEHVCRLYSFGSLPTGEPYMILEYLEGEDLYASCGRLDPATAVDLAIQTCCGLAEAHARGIVHRDIKPANLFAVNRGGQRVVKILDFGAAKLPAAEILTRTGARIGSIPYMAPEQVRSSRTVDARADIWSLGASLFHLIAGRLPFAATTAADTAIRIWTDPPAPLHEPVADVIGRCLEKRAEDRFADVAALATALAPFGGSTAAAIAERTARILGR